MPTIIFYDGDGGGFAGQLRSLLEAKFWSFICNVPLLDIYVYTNLLYENINTRSSGYLLDITLDNSISLTDILSNANDLVDAIEIISNTDFKYILAGKHHYTSHFRSLVKPIYQHCFNNFLKFLISDYKSPTYRNSALDIQDQNLLHEDFYHSIQIRTMIDSPTGKLQYRKSRPYLMGWLNEYLGSYSFNSEFDRNIFLVCDDNNERENLITIVRQHGFKVINSNAPFHHSSLARHFGSNLLSQANNKSYQIHSIKEQHQLCQSISDFEPSINTLHIWLNLCKSSNLVSNDTALSQTAYIFGEGNSFSMFSKYLLDTHPSPLFS